MPNEAIHAKVDEQPLLLRALGWYAFAGCVIFALAILIADFVVPEHDWVADTISDLGAGKYEFIVDIGIYAFAASLIACAILAAHVHLGARSWSFAIVGLILLGLIVFLVGARNEYGDNDDEGLVIHIYLVYAIGLLVLAIPLLLARGAARAGKRYGIAMIAIATIWTLSAPVFFFLPTDIDGLYERYLGVLAFALVFTLAHLFISRARMLER